MKVSLAWIFEHIVGSVDDVNLPDLIARFNESVAEIEHFYTWSCDAQQFFLVSVLEIKKTEIKVQELNKKITYTLPLREDVAVGDHLLLCRKAAENNSWARMSDCGSSKESLLPAIDPKSFIWPKVMRDTILEIDNKSITHRPDLWSHRGLAREIAALLDLQMTNPNTLFADLPVTREVPGSRILKQGNPVLIIDAPKACRRLAAGYLSAAWQPSLLPVVLRLCRVDARPIDALVDFTNYAMFDYGQPMHAFDADCITDGTLIARYAQAGEKLPVLDGSVLELHPEDLVLADTNTVLSLTGVMGGRNSSVSRATKRLCLEAGSFEPSTIRHTVTRYAKRTEASMRFEKNLDPEQPTQVLKRYVALLAQYGIPYDGNVQLVECGTPVKPIQILVAHQQIEAGLGITIAPEKVIDILTSLGFRAVKTSENYEFTVPSWRATKDIRIPEDIIEEIGRFIGYKNIPLKLPTMTRRPSVAQTTYRIRALKQYCASALRMHEISSYAFYDEAWLNHLRWQPAATLEALNPVSGNWKRLVTSLIPALLKAVHENAEGISDIRYFEVGRSRLDLSPVVEQKQLAGVIYTRDTHTDFYTLKEYVTELCGQVGISVAWHAVTEPLAPWYDPYRVAHCVYNDVIIGTVGVLADSFKDRIVQTGFVGIFELNMTALLAIELPPVQYKALPKYPDIVRDISVLISTAVPAADIARKIQIIDKRISSVEIVDFFKRPEWHDRISLSFRYIIRDATRTLMTAEADALSAKIEHMLIQSGGEIR